MGDQMTNIFDAKPVHESETLFFFVATEYQALQAHLIRYEALRNKREKKVILAILDDGRISPDCVDTKVWDQIFYFPRARDGSFIKKIIGKEYLSISRRYKNILKKVDCSQSVCLFYGNDEKIETGILIHHLKPKSELGLEDGYGNYHRTPPGIYHHLKYYLRKIVSRVYVSKDIEFSVWLGDKKFEYSCRSRPDLITDGFAFDIAEMMSSFGAYYAEQIRKNYDIENALDFSALCIARDFDSEKLKKLNGISECLVKPHPVTKLQFEKEVRSNSEFSGLKLMRPNISAELIPYFYPKIRDVYLLYPTTLAFTMSAFHPEINIHTV